MDKEIKLVKAKYSEIKTLQNEWDVIYKTNHFGRYFWKLDRKITSLFKFFQHRPFSDYPLRTLDDIQGYIEFLELSKD